MRRGEQRDDGGDFLVEIGPSIALSSVTVFSMSMVTGAGRSLNPIRLNPRWAKILRVVLSRLCSLSHDHCSTPTHCLIGKYTGSRFPVNALRDYGRRCLRLHQHAGRHIFRAARW
jgi:hypothetical protein